MPRVLFSAICYTSYPRVFNFQCNLPHLIFFWGILPPISHCRRHMWMVPNVECQIRTPVLKVIMFWVISAWNQIISKELRTVFSNPLIGVHWVVSVFYRVTLVATYVGWVGLSWILMLHYLPDSAQADGSQAGGEDDGTSKLQSTQPRQVTTRVTQ